MSENDKDPQHGEFTDPTASPDWTTPGSSEESAPPPGPAPSAPTEQIPQGFEAQGTSADSPVPPVPPIAPAPPSYDPPYAQPHGESNPYAGSSAQPTYPYAATPPPPSQDPYGAPQPAYDPYAASGAQAQPGGYPAYQAPGQWQVPPPAYGAPPAQNTSAIVLTIISGIITVSCCLPGIVPLILGIMALTKNATDPEGSRRLTKWGWIAFGVGLALALVALVVFVVAGTSGMFDGGGSFDSDYSY